MCTNQRYSSSHILEVYRGSVNQNVSFHLLVASHVINSVYYIYFCQLFRNLYLRIG
jgi:hypothetical protein